jgi:UDP-N-acetylglucosamine transferase subunit ALG13
MASFGQTKRAVLSGDSVVIFVTVGAQMPFDRLVKAVDHWARASGRDDVFAQIGLSEYRPSNMQWTRFLSPEEFKHKYETAKVIVAHAGTGSLITALQLGKPILIMPRRASLRETRNDHQVATSEHFRRFSSVAVAWDENELIEKLNRIDNLRGDTQCIEPHASHELIKAMREFIDGDEIS